MLHINDQYLFKESIPDFHPENPKILRILIQTIMCRAVGSKDSTAKDVKSKRSKVKRIGLQPAILAWP
jgi:hypothetical protein